MATLLVGWAFVVFLYLKITMEAAFFSGTTVLAALLMAVVAGLSTPAMTALYITRTRRPVEIAHGSYLQFVRKTWVAFTCCSALYTLACRLVVFGFDQDLNHEIGRWRPFADGPARDDFLPFALLVSVPMIAHHAAVFLGSVGRASADEEPGTQGRELASPARIWRMIATATAAAYFAYLAAGIAFAYPFGAAALAGMLVAPALWIVIGLTIRKTHKRAPKSVVKLPHYDL